MSKRSPSAQPPAAPDLPAPPAQAGTGEASATPAADRMPVAPERPGPGDCCHSGCAWCVEDIYADALERYHAELAAWKARHPGLAGLD